ncbi:MAG: hypothetical protein K6U87_16915 [Firmicutes bacterium]|nr:hypothetical protein [Bacillota bacterium]
MHPVQGYCSQCHGRCGTIAAVDDGGGIRRILPDRNHPNGGICAIGEALKDLPHHPARLTTPLLLTHPEEDPDPGFVPLGRSPRSGGQPDPRSR